ncbi:hypothetical protein D9M71_118730 [compost metagenome]
MMQQAITKNVRRRCVVGGDPAIAVYGSLILGKVLTFAEGVVERLFFERDDLHRGGRFLQEPQVFCKCRGGGPGKKQAVAVSRVLE